MISSVSILTAAAPLYLLYRLALANQMPVTDCDEVYNYWEPLHFVLYQTEGGGAAQQTWEYSADYALRTFAYLVPVTIPARLWEWLLEFQVSDAGVTTAPASSSGTMMMTAVQHYLLPVATTTRDQETESSTRLMLPLLLPTRTLVFLLLRCTVAATTAASELLWLVALYQTRKLSRTATIWLGIVLLTCTGMTHAAAAYLPSATWMSAWCVCAAAYLYQQHACFCVVAVTATLTTGWPFGAVCLVPMALHIVQQSIVLQQQQQQSSNNSNSLWRLIAVTVASTIVIQAATFWVDYQFYGRWTSPTANIFRYNAAAGGDELYGTEPVSYYVKNLLLNLNLLAPLGLLALPIRLLSGRRDYQVIVMMSSIVAWMAITVPRPHKEERFMFPIYPCLVLGAVLTVDSALHGIGRVEASLSRHKELLSRHYKVLHALVWIPVVLLSVSRTLALQKYYTAPLTVYAALSAQPVSSLPRLACTCGEWYRFPGSFYLPPNVQLGFLPSSFTGQLPQAFSEFGSLPESRAVLQPFNDKNRQEMERYVDIADCTWMIDLDGSECAPANSRVVARAPFLVADQTSLLHRILYLPYLHEQALASGKVKYQDYVLWQVGDDVIE